MTFSEEVGEAIEYANQRIEGILRAHLDSIPRLIREAGERGARTFHVGGLPQTDFNPTGYIIGTLTSYILDELANENLIVKSKYSEEYGWCLEVNF